MPVPEQDTALRCTWCRLKIYWHKRLCSWFALDGTTTYACEKAPEGRHEPAQEL